MKPRDCSLNSMALYIYIYIYIGGSVQKLGGMRVKGIHRLDVTAPPATLASNYTYDASVVAQQYPTPRFMHSTDAHSNEITASQRQRKRKDNSSFEGLDLLMDKVDASLRDLLLVLFPTTWCAAQTLACHQTISLTANNCFHLQRLNHLSNHGQFTHFSTSR